MPTTKIPAAALAVSPSEALYDEEGNLITPLEGAARKKYVPYLGGPISEGDTGPYGDSIPVPVAARKKYVPYLGGPISEGDTGPYGRPSQGGPLAAAPTPEEPTSDADADADADAAPANQYHNPGGDADAVNASGSLVEDEPDASPEPPKGAVDASPEPATSPEEVYQDDSPQADLLAPPSGLKEVSTPDALRPVLGKTMLVRKDGVKDENALNRDLYSEAYTTIRKKLVKTRLKEIALKEKAGASALTPEQVRDEAKAITLEASRIAARQVAASTGTILSPESIVSDREDTLSLSKGILPERSGVLPSAAAWWQGEMRDIYAGVTDTLGVKEALGDLSRGADTLYLNPFLKGFVDENDDLVIPQRAAGIPLRQVTAVLYPSSGWGYGGGNRFNKFAQGLMSIPVAAGAGRKELLDARREESGGELDFFDYLEIIGTQSAEAASSPTAIAKIRANESAFMEADDDDVVISTAGYWLATKILTGENVYDTSKNGVLRSLLPPEGEDFVEAAEGGFRRVVEALPLGVEGEDESLLRAASLTPVFHLLNLSSQAAAIPGEIAQEWAWGVGTFGERTKKGFELGVSRGDIWGDRLETDFLGPMTIALVSPDAFMLLGPVVKGGVKGVRAARAIPYVNAVSRDIAGVTSLKKTVDDLIASGGEFALESLNKLPVNSSLRLQLDEALRGIVGAADNADAKAVSNIIQRNSERADEAEDALLKLVTDSRKGVDPAVNVNPTAWQRRADIINVKPLDAKTSGSGTKGIPAMDPNAAARDSLKVPLPGSAVRAAARDIPTYKTPLPPERIPAKVEGLSGGYLPPSPIRQAAADISARSVPPTALPAAPVAVAPRSFPAVAKVIDYSVWTNRELRAELVRRGLPDPSKAKKADRIGMLRNHDASVAAAAEVEALKKGLSSRVGGEVAGGVRPATAAQLIANRRARFGKAPEALPSAASRDVRAARLTDVRGSTITPDAVRTQRSKLWGDKVLLPQKPIPNRLASVKKSPVFISSNAVIGKAAKTPGLPDPLIGPMRPKGVVKTKPFTADVKSVTQPAAGPSLRGKAPVGVRLEDLPTEVATRVTAIYQRQAKTQGGWVNATSKDRKLVEMGLAEVSPTSGKLALTEKGLSAVDGGNPTLVKGGSVLRGPGPSTRGPGGEYKPLFQSIPKGRRGAGGELARDAAAVLEAKSLQHKAFSIRMASEVLNDTLGRMGRVGTLALEKTKTVGKPTIGRAGAALGGDVALDPGALRGARDEVKMATKNLIKVLEKANAKPAATRAASQRLNSALLELTRRGHIGSKKLLKKLSRDLRTASKVAEGDLKTLVKAAADEGLISARAAEAQVEGLKKSVAALKGKSGVGTALLSTHQKAEVSALLETTIASLERAKVTLSAGRAGGPPKMVLPTDFAGFEAMEQVAKESFIKSLGPDAVNAVKAMPGVIAAKESGLTWSPLLASQVLKVAAEVSGRSAFSAWGMASYISHTQGANMGGMSWGYRAGIWSEKFWPMLRTSGMRRAFQLVASQDTYNSGRLGQAFYEMGTTEISGIAHEMTRRGRTPEEMVHTFGQWFDAPPEAAVGIYGKAGGESVLEEAFRFLRIMGDAEMKKSTSFKGIAHAFLGSGKRTKETSDILKSTLAKIVEESADNPITYREMADRMSASAGSSGANMLVDIHAHQHLAAGLINASSGQRMVEDLIMAQMGSGAKTMEAAVQLSRNSGSDTFGRAAEVRVLLQKMGVSPENFRAPERGIRGGGAPWDLVMMADSKRGMQAVVPRPLLDVLAADMDNLVKATDASKPVVSGPSLKRLSAQYSAHITLMRRGMTAGLAILKPGYFVKNIHGSHVAGISSAGAVKAMEGNVAIGRAFEKFGSGIRGRVDEALPSVDRALGTNFEHSFLNSGIPAIDARIAEHVMLAKASGQKHASMIPSVALGPLNPLIRGILDDAVIPPNHLFRTGTGEVVMKKDLIREMIKQGVFESKASTFLIARPTLSNTVRNSRIGRAIEKVSRSDWTNIWARAMDTIETEQRIGMYLNSRLRNTFTDAEAGRLVREAYFDWKYPPVMIAERVLGSVPVLMFGSMWRNAIAHSLAVFADGSKTRRLMSLYKAQELAAGGLSNVDKEDRRDPWWNKTQSFIHRKPNDAEVEDSLKTLGVTTDQIAYALPEFIELGLMATAINTVMMTAATLQTGFREPITHDNFDSYFKYMTTTSSQFIDPYLTLLMQGFNGGGDPRYGGEYAGPVKATPNEKAIIDALESLDIAEKTGFSLARMLKAETKETAVKGGEKMTISQTPARIYRLLPPLVRLNNIIGAGIREEWGDDSADYFVETMAREFGVTGTPISSDADQVTMTKSRMRSISKRVE